MSGDENTHYKVRQFLRNEAIKSGHSDVYKAFIQRPSDSKIWHLNLNGDAIGAAVTHGSNIELFHVKTGEQGRLKMVAESILAQMCQENYVVATVTEEDAEKRAFWKELGFKPKGGLLYLQLQDWQWPVDLKVFDGVKKGVAVKFFDRSQSGETPFAEMDGVGVLSDNHILHLPELAVAFDGKSETTFGRRWVSVFIDGTLQAEARLDSAKARELGMRRDAGGMPYIATVDLYTPTIL
ncbi:hypothetical protein [Rhizobium sp. BK176]|uniref:hypothetical protein n=1 Tax=Rhizobium sp. BK176 TaxID=2587071 RepID=UPI0021694D9D|nr:hypothetical protein [Rhizobium sp. BK176]MCS4089252.1 hypothetical protein [Rhizobium sp. BK176]